LETLVGGLADQLADRIGDPSALFQPVEIIVPNWNMRTYLDQEISRQLGVTPNLRFHLLRGFLADHLPTSGQWAHTQILGQQQLHHILLDLLDSVGSPNIDDRRKHDRRKHDQRKQAWLDDCTEIRDYLQVDDDVARERRLFQLCAELSRIFTEYGFSRSAPVHGPPLDEEPLLVRWRRLGASGPNVLDGVERWQQVLWWQIFGDGGVLDEIAEREGTRYLTLAEALGQVSADELAGVPETVHMVGFSYIARLFVEAMGLLGERADIHVHALSPCARWVDEPDEHLLVQHLLLRQWGSAGADHALMWRDVGDQKDIADKLRSRAPHEQPAPQTLLQALQHDIITGADQPLEPATSDAGLSFFECPSIKREVEAVANEVWTLLRDQPSLRPDDIAVVIAGADRDAYQAQIETVFSGFRALPHTIVDLPASSETRLLEAVRLLLELPFGRLTRRDLLRLLVHPNARGRNADVDPQEWVGWCEQLGILYGANREEQADSYLGASVELGGRENYEWDLYNWDQGMRRLVLGTFLSGAPSGIDQLFALGNRDYEPLEVAGQDAAQAAQFVTLVSSLIEDARWLVGASGQPPRRSAGQWAEIVDAYLTTYIAPGQADDTDDAYQFSACRRIVRQVAEQSPLAGATGSPASSRMSYRMFYEFVRDELDELQKTRGNYLTGGVIVSACLPMRAIPFDHIFVLGLGEGQFPNPEREDPLDLRYEDPKLGDLKPADRDRYTFLETLLAARRGITLSWVAREATTGEPLEASSVVNELRWVLEHRFGIPAESKRALTVRHPLRRFDYQYFPQLARAVEKPELAEPPVVDEDGRTLDLEACSPSLHAEARAEARLQALRDRLCDSGSGRLRSIASLDELRRLLNSPLGDDIGREVWQRLRRELALPPLTQPPLTQPPHTQPAPDTSTVQHEETPAPRRIRISLSKLRSFLESPLQGAAKVQLGLREDAADPFGVDREPLQAGHLDRAIALREVTFHALQHDTPPSELASLYEKLLLPRATLAGGLPGGHFLAHDRESHIDALEAWWANFEHLGIELPLVRFGIGVDTHASEHTLGAVEIELDPNRHDVPEHVIVEIAGSTEATSPCGETYVCFAENTSASPSERHFLRCFLSWVVSTAAGRDHPDEVRLVVATTKDHSSSRAKTLDRFTRRYPAWSRERASDYLAKLSASLLFDSHDYLLPIQFVAACGKSGDDPDVEQLRSWLEDELASSYSSAAFQYGPIKDYRRFGAPRDVDIAETLRARFPHLFSETPLSEAT
jgi:exodeoxyribonuclease V gamma subunit